MKTDVTLATLAVFFRRFDSTEISAELRPELCRYLLDWQNISAYRDYTGDAEPMKMEAVYEMIARSPCDWSHLFRGVHHGLIVGPETLCAIEECLQILRDDEPPEDDGAKVKHVNRLGGVNWLSKSMHHDRALTDKLGHILSRAFFADRNNRLLYSEAYTFVYTSHQGWNRSC